MPPTVQTNSREGSSRSRAADKRSELVCKVKYNNTLPDIPFDPKFITYPFDSNRYVEYKATSLESSYKYEHLTENDLGVTIDLINPETYKFDPHAALDEEDERLLEEESSSASDSKRSRHHNKNVSWLRKTEYISTEYNRFTQSAEKAESRVGFNIKKYFKEEDLYKDRDSQIQAIERSFEATKVPIEKHHTKPGVTAVEELPVFPDFDLWRHPCAQVIFDSDPARKSTASTNQNEEMSQAMIRGMVDESGDQFVAYFLPTEDTTKKRKRDQEAGVDYEEEDEYQYTLAREYNWNVKNKMSKGYEETYFMVFKEDGVFYNELETRVRLSKRRKRAAAGQQTSNTRLFVKHRLLNEQEEGAQENRLTMLAPPGEEVEEDLFEQFGDAEAQKSGDEEGVGSDTEVAANKKADGNASGAESGHESDAGSFRSGSASPRSGSASPRSVRSGSASPRSGSASPSGSGSGSGSDSGSESEREDVKRKDAEEIFGSSSDDD